MSITVGGFNFAGPSGTDFSNGLKGLQDKDLQKLLNDPSLNVNQRQAVLEEIANRKKDELAAQAAQGSQDAGEDGDELKKLMKKLKDGTITATEMERLSKLLGVDVKELEGLKGKGSDPNNV